MVLFYPLPLAALGVPKVFLRALGAAAVKEKLPRHLTLRLRLFLPLLPVERHPVVPVLLRLFPLLLPLGNFPRLKKRHLLPRILLPFLSYVYYSVPS